MHEHLLILSILGVLSSSNASIFLVPYVISAMFKVKLSRVNVVIFSVTLLLAILFTIVAVKNGFDGGNALKSNFITISLYIFFVTSAYIRYRNLNRLLEIYIFGSFLYVCFYLVSVDFNPWKLRHADDFLLLGWPTNTPLIFFVAYFIIDQSVISNKRKLLAKSFCTFIIFASLNRISVFFILMLLILDLAKNTYRSSAGFLITITVILGMFFNFAWISEEVPNLLRIDDALNSLSRESSLGSRLFTTWKLATETINTYPFFGTGGVGLSRLDSTNATHTGLTTESVYLDMFLRYGIIFGSIIISCYFAILYQIWKSFRRNVLVYPIIFAFIASFSLSDVMRFPHVIILLTTFYGYSRWKKNNASMYS